MAFSLKTETADSKTHGRHFSCRSKNAYRLLQVENPGLRFYNSGLGRWLNRDQIEEQGGANLHSFVLNDSVNGFDILGQLRFTVMTIGDSRTYDNSATSVGYLEQLKVKLTDEAALRSDTFVYVKVGGGGQTISDVKGQLGGDTIAKKVAFAYSCKNRLIVIFWMGHNDINEKVAASLPANPPSTYHDWDAIGKTLTANETWADWKVAYNTVHDGRAAGGSSSPAIFVGLNIPPVTDELHPRPDNAFGIRHREASALFNSSLGGFHPTEDALWTYKAPDITAIIPDAGDGQHYKAGRMQMITDKIWDAVEDWIRDGR